MESSLESEAMGGLITITARMKAQAYLTLLSYCNAITTSHLSYSFVRCKKSGVKNYIKGQKRNEIGFEC